MKNLKEQIDLVLNEWYDKLPLERQSKVDLDFLKYCIEDFQSRIGSKTLSRNYLVYANEKFVEEIDEWIRLIYPDAFIVAGSSRQYICLNNEQLVTLVQSLKERREILRKSVHDLSNILFGLESHLEAKEVFES